jgi:hypothetical protein
VWVYRRESHIKAAERALDPEETGWILSRGRAGERMEESGVREVDLISSPREVSRLTWSNSLHNVGMEESGIRGNALISSQE